MTVYKAHRRSWRYRLTLIAVASAVSGLLGFLTGYYLL